jgi:hypothetical protein
LPGRWHLGFYFLEYAARSSPAVMIPQLSAAFGTTAVGVSAIIGTYHYTLADEQARYFGSCHFADWLRRTAPQR